MRFHGLMLVRDEEDILPQCLDHLLTWIDAVYILDLGSTDITWQIVQDYAARDRRVVPLFSEPIIYSEGVRSFVFERFRDRFENGDWIMKLDADEFYHISPPEFVRHRIRRGETAVYLAWYFFRLTSKEVSDYESGRVDTFLDRRRPIEKRRRMYKIADYSEPRMFRYRSSMKWPETAAFPFNCGYVAGERIPIRHYPHRDPLQMEKRYRLRAAMAALKVPFPHWKLDDWRKDVIAFDPSSGIAREQSSPNEGLAASKGHTAGQLHEWLPGTILPEIDSLIHLAHPLKRLTQRIIHPVFLPILDGLRRSLPNDYKPARIPTNVTAALGAPRSESRGWESFVGGETTPANCDK
jgi:glycosyltransferase involved in cell wall biosynthesis